MKALMKVETDIITSITVSPLGCDVILVIMYVKIFKTNVIVFIGYFIMRLTSHWLIIFSIWVSSQLLAISLNEITGKMSKLLINDFLYSALLLQ
jgi:hypothetical protein